MGALKPAMRPAGRGDIPATESSFEGDLVDSLVGVPAGVFERFAPCRHAEDSAAGGDDPTVGEGGSAVEHGDIRQRFGGFQP